MQHLIRRERQAVVLVEGVRDEVVVVRQEARVLPGEILLEHDDPLMSLDEGPDRQIVVREDQPREDRGAVDAASLRAGDRLAHNAGRRAPTDDPDLAAEGRHRRREAARLIVGRRVMPLQHTVTLEGEDAAVASIEIAQLAEALLHHERAVDRFVGRAAEVPVLETGDVMRAARVAHERARRDAAVGDLEARVAGLPGLQRTGDGHDRGLLEQLLGQGRPAMTERLLGEHDHGDLVELGDLECAAHDVEAVADRDRRHDDARELAVPAVERHVQIGLLGLGRQPGARAAALDIDDDRWDLGHAREPDQLAHEGEAGARGRGHRAHAGERRAEHGRERGDLVLRLIHRAADLGQLLGAQLHDLGRRRDRVPAIEATARVERPERDRVVAAEHEVALARDLGHGQVILLRHFLEHVLAARLVGREIGPHQRVALAAEEAAHERLAVFGGEAEAGRDRAERDDVLGALLADLVGELGHRDDVDRAALPVAEGRGHVDLVGIAVDEDDRVAGGHRLDLVVGEPAEGDDHVELVAGVVDAVDAEADLDERLSAAHFGRKGLGAADVDVGARGDLGHQITRDDDPLARVAADAHDEIVGVHRAPLRRPSPRARPSSRHAGARRRSAVGPRANAPPRAPHPGARTHKQANDYTPADAEFNRADRAGKSVAGRARRRRQSVASFRTPGRPHLRRRRAARGERIDDPGEADRAAQPFQTDVDLGQQTFRLDRLDGAPAGGRGRPRGLHADDDIEDGQVLQVARRHESAFAARVVSHDLVQQTTAQEVADRPAHEPHRDVLALRELHDIERRLAPRVSRRDRDHAANRRLQPVPEAGRDGDLLEPKVVGRLAREGE